MEPNWKPLEMKVGPARCVGFMFMGRVNGINLYKHGITRTYLNLDVRETVTRTRAARNTGRLISRSSFKSWRLL